MHPGLIVGIGPAKQKMTVAGLEALGRLRDDVCKPRVRPDGGLNSHRKSEMHPIPADWVGRMACKMHRAPSGGSNYSTRVTTAEVHCLSGSRHASVNRALATASPNHLRRRMAIDRLDAAIARKSRDTSNEEKTADPAPGCKPSEISG